MRPYFLATLAESDKYKYVNKFKALSTRRLGDQQRALLQRLFGMQPLLVLQTSHVQSSASDESDVQRVHCGHLQLWLGDVLGNRQGEYCCVSLFLRSIY